MGKLLRSKIERDDRYCSYLKFERDIRYVFFRCRFERDRRRSRFRFRFDRVFRISLFYFCLERFYYYDFEWCYYRSFFYCERIRYFWLYIDNRVWESLDFEDEYKKIYLRRILVYFYRDLRILLFYFKFDRDCKIEIFYLEMERRGKYILKLEREFKRILEYEIIKRCCFFLNELGFRRGLLYFKYDNSIFRYKFVFLKFIFKNDKFKNFFCCIELNEENK